MSITASKPATDTALGPLLVKFSDIEAVEVDWVWPGRIARGRITLLVGVPGCGKSFLTADLAARISTGDVWPDDGGTAIVGDVILAAAEDDPHDTIRPRLDAHRADVNRVHLLRLHRERDNHGKVRDVPFTLQHVGQLSEMLAMLPSVRLLVIDPIGSFIGGRIDAHRDNEVRAVLTPLAHLAERHSVAVLIVMHRRKGGGSAADELAMGSRAFTGIARQVWHLTRDAANRDRRLLLSGKSNIAKEGSGLSFTIGGKPARVTWDDEPVVMSADDVLAQEQEAGASRPGPKPEARENAAGWLRDLLADGEKSVAVVRDEAGQAGFGWRTVQRACGEVKAIRERNEFSKEWQWRMPKPGTAEISGADSEPADPSG